MKNPQSILITGASGGIGAALARAYAAPGVALALTGRDARRLDAVAADCRAAGAAVETALLDVTDQDAIAFWVTAIDRANPLDLVIANAGVQGGGLVPGGGGESLSEVRRIMGTNFGGTCNTIHAVIPLMRSRRRGQIALISSLAAIRGLPYFAAYCASKAALKSYGEALGSWLRPEKIAVSVVLPGFVETAMSRQLTGPKPFMTDAAHAARIIRRRLARGHRRIAFPWLLHLGSVLLSHMPAWFADWLLAREKVSVGPRV